MFNSHRIAADRPHLFAWLIALLAAIGVSVVQAQQTGDEVDSPAQFAIAHQNDAFCFSSPAENLDEIEYADEEVDSPAQFAIAQQNDSFCFSSPAENLDEIGDVDEEVDSPAQFAIAQQNDSFCFSSPAENLDEIASLDDELDSRAHFAIAQQNDAFCFSSSAEDLDEIAYVDEYDGSVDQCWCSPWPAPNMIGDFFNGYAAGGRGAFLLDRVVVIGNDLDVPAVLPPPNSTLTLTEPGPVGTFSSSVVSVQQLQSLLRSGSPLPAATQVGSIADNATMTTTLSVTQIQTLLAATAEAYDIVPLIPPPGSYDAAVDATFAGRNTIPGVTAYDSAGSGAMLQAGADTLTGGEDFDAFYFYSYWLAIDVPSPSAGLGPMGRIKVADGNSPLPRDRAYFRYGLFSGVPIAPGGVDLDRFTPGFEKSFYDGNFSLELRFPFAASLDNDQTLGGGGAVGHDTEFGNLALYLKALGFANERMAIAGGLGITIPTAEDIQVRLVDGTPLVRVDNDSVHLKPFVAGLVTPNDRLFAQAFLEFDFDANGNPAQVNRGTGLASAGRLNDATFLFADMGIGYWLHRSEYSALTGIAPTVELHYNTSLQKADSVTAGSIRIGNFGDNVEAVNLTVGSTFQFGDSTSVSMGYVTPIGGGADRQLDSGFRVMFDHCPAGRF